MKVNRNYGFTLIEVIVALVIICIVINGFSQVIYSNMQIRRYTENKRIIINWTQTVIEYMKTENLEELNGMYTVIDFQELMELEEEYNNLDELIKEVEIKICNYTDENISENLYQVNICVKWEKDGQTKTYELSTLVYRD